MKNDHYSAIYFYEQFPGASMQANKQRFYQLVARHDIAYIQPPFSGERLYSYTDWMKKVPEKYHVKLPKV